MAPTATPSAGRNDRDRARVATARRSRSRAAVHSRADETPIADPTRPGSAAQVDEQQ